jgi:hypothetical protein
MLFAGIQANNCRHAGFPRRQEGAGFLLPRLITSARSRGGSGETQTAPYPPGGMRR